MDLARKPLARAEKYQPQDKRIPHTVWLTESEKARVRRLALVKQDDALARKALMLGVSIIENGIGGEASVAGLR